MLKSKEEKMSIKIFNVVLSIVLYIIYIVLFTDIKNGGEYNFENLKFLMSWLGIVIYVWSIYSWYKINKKVFDLYTIMLSFLMIFNYGQCILWAFNIHVDGEIGSTELFRFGIPSNREIVMTQLLTLQCIIMFNLGAFFCYKSRSKSNSVNNTEVEKDIIYKISKVMSILVIPITFIQLICNLVLRLKYGYSSLYYGDYMNGNLLQEMFSRLFFVCLFGLLIGSGFKQNVRKFTYAIFGVYIIILMICGDRGGWIYEIFIFIFLHHNYVKKLNTKSVVLIIIISTLLLNIVNAMVGLRNSDINIEEIKESMSLKNNPIVTNIAEMGGSMSIQTSLIIGGNDIYPYGNTYVFSILGIVSDKVIDLLDVEYVDLSTWFSQEYLELDGWGTGFSIVGETLINSNPYFAPFLMAILGWIISSLIYLDEDFLQKTKKTMLSLIALISLIPVCRGCLSYNLKVYFYRIFIFWVMYKIYLTAYRRKERNKS